MFKTKLSMMTWKEVDELSRDTVIFLPIGSMEQNGPHSPLQTDTLIVETFADLVAQRTDSKILDTITYSYSETFKNFPGTVFLQPGTLENLIIDICSCIINHGFKKLVLINQHLPNQAIIEHALRKIRNNYDIITPLIYTASVLSTLNDGLIDVKYYGHGCEPLNSILMSLKPEMMRMDLAEKGSLGKYKSFDAKGSTAVFFKGCPVNIYLNMEEVTPNGVYGNATIYDSNSGKELFNRLVEWGIDFIMEFKKM